MNTAKKLLLTLSLVAVSVFAFSFASPVHAQSQSAIDVLINNIRQQIAALQQQIYNLQHQQNNNVTVWCYNFNTNMGVGSSGTGVVNLQTALNKEGLYSQSQTGMFDENLASAVVAFQAKYGIVQTGYVGPLTRTKLNSLYSCNIVNNNNNYNNNVFINSVSGPSNLNVNQTGTWTVNATQNGNGYLTYSINWGDNMSPMSNLQPNTSVQTATFTHSYSSTGTFTITFTVSDQQGHTVTTTRTVVVGGTNVSTPTANNQNISVNQNGSVNITLTGNDPQNLSLTYNLVSSPSHGTLSGTAPNLVYTPYSNFNGSDNFTFTVNNGTYTSNTATVNITVNSSTSGNNPVLNGITGPTNLVVNQLGNWTVNATGYNNSPLTYTVNWGDQTTNASPMSTNSMNQTFQQTATFTHTYSSPGTYTVTFNVMDSNGHTATTTISVYVHY